MAYLEREVNDLFLNKELRAQRIDDQRGGVREHFIVVRLCLNSFPQQVHFLREPLACQSVKSKVPHTSGVVSTCCLTSESKSVQLTRVRVEICLLTSFQTTSLLFDGDAGLVLVTDCTVTITCCNLSDRATPRATHAANNSPSSCASKTESRTLR